MKRLALLVLAACGHSSPAVAPDSAPAQTPDAAPDTPDAFVAPAPLEIHGLGVMGFTLAWHGEAEDRSR